MGIFQVFEGESVAAWLFPKILPDQIRIGQIRLKIGFPIAILIGNSILSRVKHGFGIEMGTRAFLSVTSPYFSNGVRSSGIKRRILFLYQLFHSIE